MSDDALPRAHVQDLALVQPWQLNSLRISIARLTPDGGETNDTSDTDENAVEATKPLSRKEKRRKTKKANHQAPLDSRAIDSRIDSHQGSPEPTSETENEDLQPQTRKQKRKALRRKQSSSESNFETLTVATKSKSSKKPVHTDNSQSPHEHFGVPSIPPSLEMPPTQYYPLLVCSLGNPGKQYANTLHSAGHYLLDIIRVKGQYTQFSKGMSGMVSTPSMVRNKMHLVWGATKEKITELPPDEDNFTLWQSTKLMNVSGPSVKSAWQAFSAQQKALGKEGRLVIVHDELEAPLGAVTIKASTTSAKGHNGVKSCQASLQNVKYWRVGIGIGRPESREAAVVSKYVLRKMTLKEERAIEDSSYTALKALRLIAEGNA